VQIGCSWVQIFFGRESGDCNRGDPFVDLLGGFIFGKASIRGV
jgi:hypothetical protein